MMRKNERNYGINDESRADVFVGCQVCERVFSLCVVYLNEVKTILTYYAITPAHIHTQTEHYGTHYKSFD